MKISFQVARPRDLIVISLAKKKSFDLGRVTFLFHFFFYSAQLDLL